MKFKFDDLAYQEAAVNSVTELFKGQNSLTQYFDYKGPRDVLSWDESNEMTPGQGVGNRIEIRDDILLENINSVQRFHRLPPTDNISKSNLNFTIEMETGTGKTYVYLKTIFELHKKYNFTKFIIVVPSIAIKEGVYKSLQITEDKFKTDYDNIPYDYFIYDSQKLENIRNFALSNNIQIMVINIDAFRKSFTDPSKENKQNIIHRPNDRLSGFKPIDLIRETNPVVIIDEPQSTANTAKSKEAIENLNPSFTVGYSATPPKSSENLVYKLDAIDAYEQNLVKGIEVDSVESVNNHNDAYLKLISVDNKHSPITAKIEADVNENGHIVTKEVTVKNGSDLSSIKLTNREIYEGYIVDEIYCEEGLEYVKFTNEEKIIKGSATGKISEQAVKKQLIYLTIKEHLDKELEYTEKGIKVLSLFFIDKVANYRQYDENGNPTKGPYAEIFEEMYDKLIHKKRYQALLEHNHINQDIEKVHNGYFSMDKKGHYKESKLTGKEKIGKSKDDEDTYSLIMKDKEKLLSFDSPLRFIFSHSALREGWDNPNVFQICTLNETQSVMKKRQEIGRGLRLCVNQQGDRIHDKKINRLTVMANESYEDFAKQLQTEMEEEEGFKFGVLEKTDFALIIKTDRHGKQKEIGKGNSNKIFNHLKKEKIIDAKGKFTAKGKDAIKNDKITVPVEFEDIKDDIMEVLVKRTSNIKDRVKSTDDKKGIKLNKQVFLDENFKALWDKIKHKTTYQVEYDSEKLIQRCSEKMNETLDVQPPRFIYTKSGLKIDQSGVKATEAEPERLPGFMYDIDLPDILTYLQNETYLTRRTLTEILIQSQTLEQFKKNPQDYMEETLAIINKELNRILLKGLRYRKIGEEYAQELFDDPELSGYLKNMIESKKSPYNYVVYDSDIEMRFEQELEKDDDVIVYTKLPGWFKIPTPIGFYNPDWAILMEDELEEEKLYFVVETKGSTEEEDRREKENYKINCGKKHFKALGEDVSFKVESDYKKFKINI